MAEPPRHPSDGRLVASTLPADWEETAAPPAASSDDSAADGPPDAGGATPEPPADATNPPSADAPPPAAAAYLWDEGQAPPDAGGAPDSSSFPALARRSLYRRADAAPLSTREELANVIDYLQSLSTRIGEAELAAAAQAAAAGPRVLQAKRISRSGVAPDPFEIGVLPRPPTARPPEADDAQEPESARPPEVSPLAPPPAAEPPVGVRFERRHALWLLLTGALCLITLGLVAYLWTRLGPAARVAAAPAGPASRATVRPEESTQASDEALALAAQALEAIQRNDLSAASEILSDARHKGTILPGLYYQAALLAYSQGQEMAADSLIDQSIQAHDAVPECWYLRAHHQFYTAGPDEAAGAFEEAVRAAPFSPRYYFFRGECLRRNGNVTAALAQFEQALRCRPNSADHDLIVFKSCLARIESNTDTAFVDEIHERLSHAPVAGDTLLLAAAEEIGRGAYPEAAEHLRQAAARLPPAIFLSLTRDFVYRAEVRRPEIAAALRIQPPPGTAAPTPTPADTAAPTPTPTGTATPTPTPTGTATPAAPRPPRLLVDPATRSLVEADPGGW